MIYRRDGVNLLNRSIYTNTVTLYALLNNITALLIFGIVNFLPYYVLRDTMNFPTILDNYLSSIRINQPVDELPVSFIPSSIIHLVPANN